MKLSNILCCAWLALVALLPAPAGAQTEPTAAIYSSLTGQLTMPLVKRDGVYYANAIYSLPAGQAMQMTTPGSATSSWETRLPVHDTQAGTIFLPRVSLGSEDYYNVLVAVPANAAWSVKSLWQGVNTGSGFPIVSTISNRWATDAAGILSYVLDNGQVWRIAQGGEEPCFPITYANANAMTQAESSTVEIYPNSSSPSTAGVSNTDYLMLISYSYRSLGGSVFPLNGTLTQTAVDTDADGTNDTVKVFLNGGTDPVATYASAFVMQPITATAVESCTVYPILVNGATIPPTTALAAAPAAVTGNVGRSAEILVSGGVPPYTITIDNSSVAQVTAQTPATSTTGQQVSMQLASAGTATMSVVDYAQTRLAVPITVTAAALVTSEAALSGSVGDTPTVYVYGGIPPYSVTSSNTGVATVSAVQSGNGMSLTVRMLGAGTATILVTDPDTSATLAIPVTVITAAVTPLAASEASLSGSVGDTPTLYVFGGIPPYSVTSSNSNVVAVSASAQSGGGMNISLAMRAVGTATILVVDPDTTSSLAIPVTVVASSTPPFSIAPSAIDATEGASGYIYLIGGTPPFTVANVLPSAASVVYDGISAEGWPRYRFALLKSPGDVSFPVVFTDAAGQSQSIQVKIKEDPNLTAMTLTPQSISAHAFANEFPLYIGGGHPPYVVYSGMSSIEVSKITDTAYRVKVNPPYLNYTTNITVIDSASRVATLPVTVSAQPPGYDAYK